MKRNSTLCSDARASVAPPPPSEFMLGNSRVRANGDGSYWLYPRSGARGRYCGKNSESAQAIESGRDISLAHAAHSRMAAGTHEPLVYFRDDSGKIGIPLDPSLVPPEFTRMEARTLADIDRLMSEMSRDQLDDFRDEGGEFQQGLDVLVGNPRKHLVDQLGRSISNKERDVIHEMIKSLDGEQAERQKLSSSVRHHMRDQ